MCLFDKNIMMQLTGFIAAAVPFLCVFYWLTCVVWGIWAVQTWRTRQWNRVEDAVKNGTLAPEAVAPFRRLDSDKTIHNTMYCVFGILFLLPVRLGLLICLCTFSYPVFKVAELYYTTSERLKKNDDYDNNHSKIRMLTQVITRCILWLFGVGHIREHLALGRTDYPRRDTVTTIVSNHVSILDILYFIWRLFPSFVAKASVSKIPLVASCCTIMDCIYVNRESVQDRNRVLECIGLRQNELSQRLLKTEERSSQSNSLIKSHLKRSIKNTVKKPPLILFPEGTTSTGVTILPFKRGAFWNLQRVTPVVLHYISRFFNPAFDIINPSIWFPLMMISPFFVNLEVYWLPDEDYPTSPNDHDSHEARVNQFKAQTRHHMLTLVEQLQSSKTLCPRLDDNFLDILPLKYQMKEYMK